MNTKNVPAAGPQNCDDPSLVQTTKLPAKDVNNTADFPQDAEPYHTIAPSGDALAAPLRMIGRYTVLGKLGSGGQADVFRAVHPTLPIEVPIKLGHGQLDDRARTTLRDEAHILCDLDHPHIAKIRDFDFANGQPFMVLDFIRGRSLAQVADAHPFKPVDAAKLVAKVARAIGFANARGVIHRDLKPENVVIDGNGEPKVIDFGMSRLRSALRGTAPEANEVSGTLAYMAPEQAEGITSKTDHRVDIFALGAILYRLLVGTPPYPRLPMMDLLGRVRKGTWETAALDATIAPEGLKAICHRAMQVNSSDRFPTAESFADALTEFTARDRSSEPDTHSDSKASTKQKWQFSATGLGCAVSLTVGLSLMFLAPGLWLTRQGNDGEVESTLPLSPTSRIEDTHALSVDNADYSFFSPIQSFDVIQIGNSEEKAAFSGSLMQFRPPHEHDDIRVQAKFWKPAYCYLVALNPDGANSSASLLPITKLN